MNRKWLVTAAAMLTFVFICGADFASAIAPKDVSRMDKKDLREKLGDPEIEILDVRVDKDWKKGIWKIKTAVRRAPENFAEWVPSLDKKKTYVLYGLQPEEADAADLGAKMLNMGFKKVFVLKGGFLDWLKMKYPMDTK